MVCSVLRLAFSMTHLVMLALELPFPTLTFAQQGDGRCYSGQKQNCDENGDIKIREGAHVVFSSKGVLGSRRCPVDSSQYAPIGYLPGAFGCPGRAPRTPELIAERSGCAACLCEMEKSQITSNTKGEIGI
jgi:hypothetical protein